MEHHPDFRVKLVDRNENLAVQIVNGYTGKCGQWLFVEYAEDFKIQFVDFAEDFTIRFDPYFPGLH